MSNLTKKQEELKASLKHGDRAKIAKRLLMKRQELSMVLNGKKEDERVWTAIEEFIAYRPKTETKPSKESSSLKKAELIKENEELKKQVHTLRLINSANKTTIESLETEIRIIEELGVGGGSDETLANLQQQYSNAQEHIVRLKKERDELK